MLAEDDAEGGIWSSEGAAHALGSGDIFEKKRGAWQCVTDLMPKILAPMDRLDFGGDDRRRKMFAGDELLL